jgi:GDPmannose 4,6-dehydratase
VFACEGDQPVERKTEDVRLGDHLRLINLPPCTDVVRMTEDEAWLLGMIVAEGYVSEAGKIQITNQDDGILNEVAACWQRVTGGAVGRYVAASGFETGHPVAQLRLTGDNGYGRYIHSSIYTRSGHKRIPKRVLNASKEVRMAFLRGYNLGDGLKRARGDYEFKSFKTSSAVLAAGLYWMVATTLGQRAIISVEERDEMVYYQINLNTPNDVGGKGRHLRQPLNEVVKATPVNHSGWLFDFATESQTFHAGVGMGWIHNSPRRGLEFVTHKVTYAVARIKLGLQKELHLGNLDARRDWGFAGDYVRGMWMMLQQDRPDDYVLATGETHSVEELCQVAFDYAGLNWKDHVVVDPKFYRPAEVDLLIGDPAKAGKELGWEPQVTFEGLVKMMVDADLKELQA